MHRFQPSTWIGASIGACLIVLASLAAGPTHASQSSAPADPVPNQACGSSSLHTTTGESAEASSCFGSDPCVWATSDAKTKLLKKLGRASGVVCKICPDGIQCGRSVTLGASGYSISCNTYQQNGQNCCKCTASFTGSYTVSCAACPTVLEGGGD